MSLLPYRTWEISGTTCGREFRLNQAIPGPGPLNPRRPLFTKFGLTQGITDASTKGSNNYNALQTKLNKRFSRNFSLLVSYTWSKTIDNSHGLLLNDKLNRAWRTSTARTW